VSADAGGDSAVRRNGKYVSTPTARCPNVVAMHRGSRKRLTNMLTEFQILTPAGTLVAVARGSKLVALVFRDHWGDALERLEAHFGKVARDGVFPKGVSACLGAYLEGDIAAIDGLAVDVDGTPFQKRVWDALRTIPAGETISYQELARRVGAPAAVRAVGNANGKNPVGVVVPCHRVIHADGSIGGYGGGIERKRWLLDHEQKHARRVSRRAYA
jgi:methylated-DNA-[protein]-cysteine S-methyltransferase